MTQTLTIEAIDAHLTQLAGWRRDGDELVKEFEFADFNAAFRFLSGVALLAERADHHPEIWNVYNRVRLRLSTHDAAGVTHKDIALATAIEGLS